MKHTCEWHPAVACPGAVVALVDGVASYGAMADGTTRSTRYLCAYHLARIPDGRARIVETFDSPTPHTRKPMPQLRAKIVASGLDVVCPKCGTNVAEPRSGSFIWTVEDVRAATERAKAMERCTCTECGARFAIVFHSRAQVALW